MGSEMCIRDSGDVVLGTGPERGSLVDGLVLVGRDLCLLLLVPLFAHHHDGLHDVCLLYTSDAADERSSVDLGGRRIIKKKKYIEHTERRNINTYK